MDFFSVGNDELEKLPKIGSTIICDDCGCVHPVKYGKRILPDGSEIESKTLAFYKCGGDVFRGFRS